ncbi:Protein TAPETUM DETERMINANT 1 [Zostera marina]|uniref:Protein TAPETUM DETERMINANT 1 n=1 Tax=Zostera marina TaxID=29655 RepID=A0A0K9NRG5_ZOSMR|nr:Protein TAPETUM DETERMINANT 1 [Zostera marina]
MEKIIFLIIVCFVFFMTHAYATEDSTHLVSLENMSKRCNRNSVVVSHGQTHPLPNHIPTYTVHITNICPSRCSVYGIHVKCGWFSSTRLINPKIFRRLGYNDCLVNNGHVLPAGRTVSFMYSNTYTYPMDVFKVSCA